MAEISIKKAAIINAVSKYSTILINVVLSAVLARLLTPDDYGIVAVTTVFTTFFGIIANLGLGTAVIQMKDLERNDIDNIFSFTVKISILLGVLFACLAVPIAFFYNNNVYISIIPLLGLSLMFSTLNMIPNALLMKEKKFVLVGIRTILITIVSGILTIIMALCGFKYYAIVIQSIISAICTFIWNYVSTKPRFKWKNNKESIAKVRSYSGFQFGFNIINYFARNLDNLIISKLMGTAALGYYDKAYKLMLYPVQNLTNVITPVLHPILSDHQKDINYIYNKYIDIIKLLSLIGVFVTPICFCAADEIIYIMFGDQWAAAVPCFRLMALSIWAQMLLSSTGSIFQSIGNTRLLFITGNVTSIMTVSGILLGIIEGNIEAVSRNIMISYNLQFVFSFYMLINKGMKINIIDFIRKMLPDICMLIALIIISIIVSNIINIDNILISLTFKIAIIISAYIIMLCITGQKNRILKYIPWRK